MFRAQLRWCGSVMIEGHVRFSGLENKFSGSNSILPVMQHCEDVD